MLALRKASSLAVTARSAGLTATGLFASAAGPGFAFASARFGPRGTALTRFFDRTGRPVGSGIPPRSALTPGSALATSGCFGTGSAVAIEAERPSDFGGPSSGFGCGASWVATGGADSLALRSESRNDSPSLRTIKNEMAT